MLMKINLYFLPELERSAKTRVLRRLRQRYRNTFHHDDEHWMHCSSIQIKNQKTRRDYLNPVNVTLTGNTEYTFWIKNFKAKVRQGPFYVCVICNRCLYYTNVLLYDIPKYDNEFMSKLNNKLTGFDGKSYISKTCNSSTKKLKVPCQAVVNSLFL